MNEFSVVGSKILSMIKGGQPLTPVNKSNILSQIENNLVTLRLVNTTYLKSQPLFTTLGPQINLNKSVISDDVKKIYLDYIKLLSTTNRRQEENNFLSTFNTTALALVSDHELIRDQFDSCFKEGTDAADITPEQMRLTHAVIFGYLNLSATFADWFCFFVDMLSGDDKVPPYRKQLLSSAQKDVADLVNTTSTIARGRSILDTLQDVRKEGDVTLYHQTSSFDSYVDANHYTKARGFIAQFNPVLILREAYNNYVFNSYKRNLIMRDWIQAKMQALQMQANNIDPQSSQYQRQMMVIQKYSDILADYDKKLAHYENT